jgi:hypothetical protein
VGTERPPAEVAAQGLPAPPAPPPRLPRSRGRLGRARRRRARAERARRLPFCLLARFRGTVMRYGRALSGVGTADSVPLLAKTVALPPLRRACVPAPRLACALAPRLGRAGRAVAVPSVAGRADPDLVVTSPAVEQPKAVRRSVPPRGLDKADAEIQTSRGLRVLRRPRRPSEALEYQSGASTLFAAHLGWPPSPPRAREGREPDPRSRKSG